MSWFRLGGGLTRAEALRWFLVGLVVAPVMALILGIGWPKILIFVAIGGPVGVGSAAKMLLLGGRNRNERDERKNGWTDTDEAPDPGGQEYAPRSNQVRSVLLTSAIIAGVACGLIIGLVLSR